LDIHARAAWVALRDEAPQLDSDRLDCPCTHGADWNDVNFRLTETLDVLWLDTERLPATVRSVETRPRHDEPISREPLDDIADLGCGYGAFQPVNDLVEGA
jgi:hypothetical protein